MSGYCACVAPPTSMETTISYSKKKMVENFKQIESYGVKLMDLSHHRLQGVIFNSGTRTNAIYTRMRINLSAQLVFISPVKTAGTL